jgi:hypothetical protein
VQIILQRWIRQFICAFLFETRVKYFNLAYLKKYKKC